MRGVARTAPLMYLMPPVAGLVAWALTGERYIADQARRRRADARRRRPGAVRARRRAIRCARRRRRSTEVRDACPDAMRAARLAATVAAWAMIRLHWSRDEARLLPVASLVAAVRSPSRACSKPRRIRRAGRAGADGDRAAAAAAPTGRRGIAWTKAASDADVDAAFAPARAESKPVFLYWGAKWCPPCNQVQATLFNRQDFIERSRAFVPVYVDGDSPGAQKLGTRFRSAAIRRWCCSTPSGERVTRLPGEVDAGALHRGARRSA